MPRMTDEERIARDEERLGALKGRVARRRAVETDEIAKKLARAMRILRSVEKDDEGDLAVWCGDVAARLDAEIQRIAGQMEMAFDKAAKESA